MAIFIPHNGCKNDCSFCNQKQITGQAHQPSAEEVKNIASAAAAGLKGQKCEIAFFGGSFTAVDKDYMTELLSAAKPFVESGFFEGIRVSTRPDCIDEEILKILKYYKVTTIELGCQSMNDRVLKLNKRGHTSGDVYNAVERIKKYDFALGLQMMTGLFGSTQADDMNTAEIIAGLKPDCVRIYPTIVLKGTHLEELYNAGSYRPQALLEAVELCKSLLLLFRSSGIPVIRLGLHSSDGVTHDMAAGPFHPAFRQLCESAIWFEEILCLLKKRNRQKGRVKILVHPKNVSRLVGQKRCNLKGFLQQGYELEIIQDSGLLEDYVVL